MKPDGLSAHTGRRVRSEGSHRTPQEWNQTVYQPTQAGESEVKDLIGHLKNETRRFISPHRQDRLKWRISQDTSRMKPDGLLAHTGRRVRSEGSHRTPQEWNQTVYRPAQAGQTEVKDLTGLGLTTGTRRLIFKVWNRVPPFPQFYKLGKVLAIVKKIFCRVNRWIFPKGWSWPLTSS
jgi:hypothetical protein